MNPSFPPSSVSRHSGFASSATSSFNIKDLYEQKQKDETQKLQIFDEILRRVHQKIKFIAHTKPQQQYCFYQVPYMLPGLPCFSSEKCCMYLYHQLQQSKFQVYYTHPNLFYIAWNHLESKYNKSGYNELSWNPSSLPKQLTHQIDRTPQPATPALSYSGSTPSPLSMNTNQPLQNAIHGTNTRQVSISTPHQCMERTQQGNTITLRRAKHYKPRGSQ